MEQMDIDTQRAIIEALEAFDDGPWACTGTRDGELVWKASFATLMERLRLTLPADVLRDVFDVREA